MINWSIIFSSLPLLLRGLITTLEIAAISVLAGLTGGTILGLMQTSGIKIFRYIAGAFVTVIRGTPMLVQIAFVFFLFQDLGLRSALLAAIVAISINSSAYVSQVIRSGITSVSKGQIEAGKVLGLSNWQITRYIVLPQAFRVVIPALGNEFITLVKDSSLASTIGVIELYQEGRHVINKTYDVISVFLAITVIYLIVTTTVSAGISILEKRLNVDAKN